MLSVIFVYLMQPGWKHKSVVLLSVVPIAVAANIVRVTGTGVLAHFFGDQVARGFLHEFSGLAVFAFGVVVLFLEYSLLNRIDQHRGSRRGVDGRR
jgi:exosortase/archaeosortase family protein